MKITKLLSIVTFSILIASCSKNEEILQEETNAELLESFKIAKNDQGKYTVDYTTNNATSQIVKNVKSNTNEIFLYASELEAKNSFSENLEIDNDKLVVGFIDTNTDKKPMITVIDDNIVFAKDSENNPMLKKYSVTGNANGTYDLDFSVKNKIEVDFVYNEEINTYEVHLVKGDGNVSDFTRTFSSDCSNELRIDFVNHKNTAAKGYAYREAEEAERKPRMIIVDFESN